VPTEQELKNEANTYLDSVLVVCGIVQHLGYEFNAKSYPGLIMKSDGNDVIPDLTCVIPAGEVLVFEIRLSIPGRTPESCDDCFGRVKKYSEINGGWPVKNLSDFSSCVITHQTNGPLLKDYFEKIQSSEDDNKKIKKKWAVLSYNHTDQSETFICIEKRAGELTRKLEKHFAEKNPRTIKDLYVYEIFKDIKFYDADPPVQYTMAILWDHIFPSFMDQKVAARDTKSGRRIFLLRITKEQILERLSKFCYRQELPNQKKIPRDSWVENALNKLKEFELIKEGDEEGVYHVKYYNIPKREIHGSLQYFASEMAGPKQVQLPLDS